MSVAKKILMGSGAVDDYEIDQSLTFEPNAHLSKDVGSASNRKTWTWSAWVKRGKLGTSNFQSMFMAYDNSSESNSTWLSIDFRGSGPGDGKVDTLGLGLWSGSLRITSRRFRDVSAWYHIVVALDTTDSTAGDRVKVYVNGVQETSFSETTNPDEDDDLGVNAAQYHMLGVWNYSSTDSYFSGYMAEVNFIDGTALTPSAFGETNSDTGQWVPKKYDTASGAYGTNGFYFKFVSGALGTDSSGEGNDYGTANLDNYDSTIDTPTNDFATWNPLDTGPGTVSQGMVKIVTSNHCDTGATFAFPSTGKWYFEMYLNIVGTVYAGITPSSYTGTVGSWNTSALAILGENGNKYSYYDGGWQSDSYGSAFSNGDILQCAVDMDNGKIWWGDAGTWIDSGDPAAGSDEAFTFTASLGWKPFIYGPGSSNAINVTVNFGARPTFNGGTTAGGNADAAGIGDFKYAVPSGFKALCASNLPTPTIALPGDNFNVVRWAGNSSSHAITVGFQPDFVWLKKRSGTSSHYLSDSVRGAHMILLSESTAAQWDATSTNDGVDSFDSNGFTLQNGTYVADYNASGSTYVSWDWKAGGAPTADNSAGAGATPTAGSVKIDGSNLGSALAGSIAATRLSANTTAGFSIVKFTMPGSGQATVAHGLGVAPEVIITKDLESASQPWLTYAAPVTDTTSKYLLLNTTGAVATYSTVWGAALPTSSVFGVTYDGLAADNDLVAYCFASVAGYSKVGTYEGNNSTTGPYIHCGFNPAYILIKYADGTGESWWIQAWETNSYNKSNWPLFANLNAAESEAGEIDFLSNGFKLRATNGGINGNTDTYMYMAFADYPFKYSNAR